VFSGICELICMYRVFKGAWWLVMTTASLAWHPEGGVTGCRVPSVDEARKAGEAYAAAEKAAATVDGREEGKAEEVEGKEGPKAPL
jgi:hypothetical protein